MVEVTQFQRRSGPGNFSVERLFADIREALPANIHTRLVLNKHASKGLFPRLSDAWRARRLAGAVNHILGDVHYLAWLLPRRRLILTVLDCVSLERLSGIRRWVLWFFWYWGPVRRARHITVISEFSKNALLKWVKIRPNKIAVIYPPLSSEFTASPARPHGGWRQILQIGTSANKNLPRVIAALTGLDVTLTIVGDVSDDLRAQLREADLDYRQLANLTREELLAAYHATDIVMFASTYEGFGLPIVEANAVGRPVITSNCCSMPEAAGDAALLVDPYSVEEIRQAVQSLMTDERLAAGLIERGLPNAERFRPDRIAEQFADLYRRASAEG